MKLQNAAVIIGVGPEKGLGAALSILFAAKGLHVFIAGRSADKLASIAQLIRDKGGSVTPVKTDATIAEEVDNLFAKISGSGCILDIAVYNVDSNIPSPLLETDTDTFTKLWQQNCLGGFLFGKGALKLMIPQGKGTIIFTGATGSLRARPPFTAFAASKAGLRALAQGMAREFSPKGIHVIHTVIDGVIDGDRARNQFPEFVKNKGQDGLLKLEAIAETYWNLHQQDPSTWTHELDLRPYKEPF